jgi:transcriptional regulator with XRE-family HTH domain
VNITREYLALAGRIVELADEYPSRMAFANAVGVSRAAVYAWTGCQRHPQADSLMRICILLNVQPNWLLLGIGPKRPHFGGRIAKMVVDAHAA